MNYYDYDPSQPPDIEPNWDLDFHGEDRVAEEEFHTWDEVAADFAERFGIPEEYLRALIQVEIDDHRHTDEPLAELPTDTQACEAIHEIWKKLNGQ